MINWSVDWPKIYQRYSDWDLRPPLSLDRLILSIDSLLGNWGILLSWKRILFFDFLSNFPLAQNLQLCTLCTCISIITDIRDLLPFLSVSFVSTAAIFCLHHPLAPISIYYSSTCIPVSSSFASNQLSNSISPPLFNLPIGFLFRCMIALIGFHQDCNVDSIHYVSRLINWSVILLSSCQWFTFQEFHLQLQFVDWVAHPWIEWSCCTFDHLIKSILTFQPLRLNSPLHHFAFPYLFWPFSAPLHFRLDFNFSVSFKFSFCFGCNSLSILLDDVQFNIFALQFFDPIGPHCISSEWATVRFGWLRWVGPSWKPPHRKPQNTLLDWDALGRHLSVMQKPLLGLGSIQLSLQYRWQCYPATCKICGRTSLQTFNSHHDWSSGSARQSCQRIYRLLQTLDFQVRYFVTQTTDVISWVRQRLVDISEALTTIASRLTKLELLVYNIGTDLASAEEKLLRVPQRNVQPKRQPGRKQPRPSSAVTPKKKAKKSDYLPTTTS